MSFLKYKFEWARLEGWRDYLEYVRLKEPHFQDGWRLKEPHFQDEGARGHSLSQTSQTSQTALAPDWPEDIGIVEEWSELAGTREPIMERVIDARAAAQSKMSMKENLTLFEEVAKLAEGFVPASGQKIAVGLDILRDRIETGRYRITANCTNTIFAYEQYTGRDGQKGAVKDWIDNDRYAALSGVTEYEAEAATECGDGRAGAQPSRGRNELQPSQDDEDADFAGWAD